MIGRRSGQSGTQYVVKALKVQSRRDSRVALISPKLGLTPCHGSDPKLRWNMKKIHGSQTNKSRVGKWNVRNRLKCVLSKGRKSRHLQGYLSSRLLWKGLRPPHWHRLSLDGEVSIILERLCSTGSLSDDESLGILIWQSFVPTSCSLVWGVNNCVMLTSILPPLGDLEVLDAGNWWAASLKTRCFLRAAPAQF